MSPWCEARDSNDEGVIASSVDSCSRANASCCAVEEYTAVARADDVSPVRREAGDAANKSVIASSVNAGRCSQTSSSIVKKNSTVGE
jgi:hypothetical protein